MGEIQGEFSYRRALRTPPAPAGLSLWPCDEPSTSTTPVGDMETRNGRGAEPGGGSEPRQLDGLCLWGDAEPQRQRGTGWGLCRELGAALPGALRNGVRRRGVACHCSPFFAYASPIRLRHRHRPSRATVQRHGPSTPHVFIYF